MLYTKEEEDEEEEEEEEEEAKKILEILCQGSTKGTINSLLGPINTEEKQLIKFMKW